MDRIAAVAVGILASVVVVVAAVVAGAALNRAVPNDGVNLQARTAPPPTVGEQVGMDDDWHKRAAEAAAVVAESYQSVAFYAGRGDAARLVLECSRVANSYTVRQATETLMLAPNPQFAATAAAWSQAFYTGMRACADGDIDSAVDEFRETTLLLAELEMMIRERQVV